MDGAARIRRFQRRDGRDATLRVLVMEIAASDADRDRAPWLLFAVRSAHGRVIQRRRYAPLPADWTALTDAELDALYERAVAVPFAAPAPPPPPELTPSVAESLAEELEFTRMLLAAANDDREHLHEALRACEAELAATNAELATFNAELQALYGSLWP